MIQVENLGERYGDKLAVDDLTPSPSAGPQAPRWWERFAASDRLGLIDIFVARGSRAQADRFGEIRPSAAGGTSMIAESMA